MCMCSPGVAGFFFSLFVVDVDADGFDFFLFIVYKSHQRIGAVHTKNCNIVR